MTDQLDFQQVGEEFIEHFGKRGMRWGHRSSKTTSKKGNSRRSVKPVVKQESNKKAGAAYAVFIIGLVGARIALSTISQNVKKVTDGSDFLTNPKWYENYTV